MSEQGGENKRTEKRPKKGPQTDNKNISTRDIDQPANKGKTQIKVSGNINNKKNNTKDLQNNSQTKGQEEKELNVYEQTQKLQEELEEKKLKMEKQNKEDIDQINLLNQKLSTFDKRQKVLLTKNNNLISELKKIDQQVSNKLTNSKLSRVIAKKKKLGRNFNIEIKAKEGQKNTKIKYIKINDKEIQRLNKLLEKTDEENEEKLNEDLARLNEEITYK